MRFRWLALPLIGIAGCTALPSPELVQAVVCEEADDPLTLAAECLGRGEESAAAGHFETYVRDHPDQVMFRIHLSDLLFKLHRLAEARSHYERFIGDAQDSTGPPKSRLIHCHTKLMEIAQLTDDRFGELFHRGVGLLLLTREETADEEVGEEILCRAIKALREAADEHPADPRVHVYLAEAYERSGNRRAAEISRAAARNNATPYRMTPNESRTVAGP
jgi:hypothetical protein